MKLYIYTDGAARGNPGESASGFLILSEQKKVVVRNFFYNGTQTNNVAEYLAIIAALKKADADFGAGGEVELYSDSELVVNQINGRYKVRDKRLKALHKEAIEAARRFRSCTFSNLPREDGKIAAVDRELNRLLDARERDDRAMEDLKTHGRQGRL
ncbi:MAG: ribonuclease HI family protein [Candidatus Micrarchaeota archaeon]|nr:ribonuclease HI family protein [Candidatus Micrarchaeota archaeon]MDE1804658.1 ribonuclease HI family protein [Candidatus Micrarchaeota archaeon]